MLNHDYLQIQAFLLGPKESTPHHGTLRACEASRLFHQICDAVRYLHVEKQLVRSPAWLGTCCCSFGRVF